MAIIVGGTTVTGTQTLEASTLTGTASAINGSNITNLPAPSSANGPNSAETDAVCRHFLRDKSRHPTVHGAITGGVKRAGRFMANTVSATTTLRSPLL